MGWRCTWHVTCDVCHKPSPGRYKGNRPGEDAARHAVKLGWVRGNAGYGIEVHLCPDCAKLPRPDWWPEEE